MALQLFRLASVTPSVTTTNYAYFTTATAAITLTNGVSHTLLVSTWNTGDGNAATAFVSSSGGYNLSINGVLQQSGLYTVNTGSSVKLVAPSDGLDISASSPITLQAVDSSMTPTEVAIP